MIILRLMIITALMVLSLDSYTQELGHTPRLEQAVNQEEIDQLVDQLELRKTKKEWRLKEQPKEKESNPELPKPGLIARILANALYYVLIIVIVGLVIGLLIYLINSINYDKRIDHDIIEEEQEEVIDIKELNLGEMLAQALASGDYRMAIRIEFLIILQQLTIEKHIDWSPDKTNRDYKKELRYKDYLPKFNSIVNLYERVWYGESKVDEGIYLDSRVLFADFSRIISLKTAEA